MYAQKTILSISIIFLLFSCETDRKGLSNGENNKPAKADTIKAGEEAGRVVLIFEKPPINNRYELESGQGVSNNGIHEIAYIDDQSVVRLLPLQYDKDTNILILKIKREAVEIQHAYKGIDKLNYLFHKGDSVLFTYDSLQPIATVLNRKVFPLDVNYELEKRQRILNNEFPATLKKQSFFNFYNFKTAGFVNEIKRVYKEAEKDGKKQTEAELIFLDSLKQNALISAEVYKYYKTKAHYDSLRLQLDQANVFLIKESLDPNLMASLNKAIQEKQNDSLLEYGFYRDFLNLIFRVENRKVKRTLTSNSNMPDFKAVYDSINNNSLLSPKTRKILLLSTMDNLVTQSSIAETQKYLKRFESDVKDTAFVNYLTAKYNLGAEVSKGLALKNSANQNLSFDAFLKQNEGRVVYVDFWASWCAPCIRAFPASKELRKAYANKEVLFAYLSTDENQGQWEKAAKKHGLIDYKNSYLILNQHTSKLLEALQVSAIPRYLIYDTKGKLVHKNAPGPDSKEIRKLLDDYLARK